MMSSASPVPKIHSPAIRIANVLGFELQRESERQRVTGTLRDGVRNPGKKAI
jgi:hypothetical protein